MKKRIARMLIIANAGFTLALALVAFTPVSNWLAASLIDGLPPEGGSADVILVMASGIHSDGTLGDESIIRTITAVSDYKDMGGAKIIFSGEDAEAREKYGFSMAKLMADLGRKMGVADRDIIVEDRSTRTYTSAIEIKMILDRLGLKKAGVVSSSIHLKRIILALKRQGIDSYPLRVPRHQPLITGAVARIQLFHDVMHEYAGLALYWWRGWI